ncbi:hypothetical protein AB1A81_15540 [Bdellovibrio bacteriovorus]|nr:hypothetical protein [Bdellovibrio bacteriovorus]AHZ83750.1 hypothetical protein EP01_02150 [Bdellovibrio bacteriovorus]BEV69723.1 hypothetical protein Bb109J_c3143 [Bdellovibrio bacteriovorus]
MAFLSRYFVAAALVFGSLPSGAQPRKAVKAEQIMVNKAAVEVVPFSSLQKHIHPFQTDCRNILREPKAVWDQFEIIKMPNQEVMQLKISGELQEDLNIRFWSRRILLYDKKNKPLPPVILPLVNLPLKADTGKFLISLNVPLDAQMIAVPLELFGDERFRYLIRIKGVSAEMKVTAMPMLDKVGKDFCSRDLMWAGLGLMGSVQKQDTSPIVTTLDQQSFTFDTLSFERRWNWKTERSIRLQAYTSTFAFNNLLNTSAAERIYNIKGDVAFTKRHWTYRNPLFKVQYGYLLGGEFERRAYSFVKSATEAGIGTGMHVSATGGGYAELFSHNNKWYTDVSMRMHPFYMGIDHTYSGFAVSGTLGLGYALDYERSLGVYTYGTFFQGQHTGSDDKDNSKVSIFETHLEFRYGWLF